MLRVGLIGFGFMGRMHYRCWCSAQDACVVALCDANQQAWTKAGKGNIAGSEGEVDLSALAVYADPDAMLACEKLDAVSITVPTHLHAELAVKALGQGVHVLCEKPMALSLADGRRMIEAAAKSGGMVFDLHIHDTDFIQYLFGLPKAVCSHAAMTHAGSITHLVTRYRYTDGQLVTAEGGWAMTPSYGFEMKFLIVMEKAVLAFNSKCTPTLKLYPAEGDASVPRLEAGDGYSRQVEYFVKTLRGEPVPIVTTPEQALETLRIAEAERESARKGRYVNVN